MVVIILSLILFRHKPQSRRLFLQIAPQFHCALIYHTIKRTESKVLANDSVLFISNYFSFQDCFHILPHSYIAVLVIVPVVA